jgi:RNA polymerase sigma-70 factor, ECF subfamily
VTMPMGECREGSQAGSAVRWSANVSSHPLYRKSYREPISAVFPSLALRDGSRAYLLGLDRSAPRTARGDAPLPELSRPTTWQSVYDRGRQVWSKVCISFEQFLAHAQALEHREPPAHALDLYLTAACRYGRGAAFEVLEQEFIERTRSVVQNVLRDAWVVDDVLQDVRRRLLVGPASKIVCYRGTGPLASWIRAIALNVARDYLRTETSRRRREETQGYALFFGAGDVPLQDESLAHCISRQGRGAACLDAVRGAFQSLPRAERQLLHDYYLRGFSIDALAPLYDVNRATVARRVRRATDAVRRQVRRHLALLYPREDLRALDSIALAACRELIADPASLLPAPPAPDAIG